MTRAAHIAPNERTRVPDVKGRFDGWSYDSEGYLVWHLALSSDGELLSHWYDVGYKRKLWSSDSLVFARPRLCVSYKFDEPGSGRMKKVVQHTFGQGNLELATEELYLR